MIEARLPVNNRSIPDHMLKKWQSIANILAEILEVPAGLVMRLSASEIEVFITSDTRGNPYPQGEKAPLNGELYCETVIDTNSVLKIPNALSDPDWDKNPDVELGMISYLGMPLFWPDQSPFGTICALDHKENHYSNLHEELLKQLQLTINADLELLFQMDELQKSHEQLMEKQKLEAQHRMLCALAHRLNTPIGVGVCAITELDSILQQGEQSSNAAEYCELIKEQLFTMRNLIKRSQAFNHNSLDRTVCDFKVDEFFNNLKAAYMQRFECCNVAFETTNQVTEVVTSDLEALMIIFDQLIDNSLEHAFAEQEKPKIEIVANLEDNRLIIEYLDNGAGLSELQYDHQFEAFVGRKGVFEPGSGLGLAMIHNLTNQSLSGSVKLSEASGGGLRVVFDLPVNL